MRLKSWHLIWIFTDQWGASISQNMPIRAWRLDFCSSSLLSVFTENPDTRRISVVCTWKVSRNNSEDLAIYFAALLGWDLPASRKDLSYFQVLLTRVICKQFGIIIPCQLAIIEKRIAVEDCTNIEQFFCFRKYSVLTCSFSALFRWLLS